MVDRYPAAMLDYEWGNPSTVIISGETHHDPFPTGGGGGAVINNVESSSLNLIYHHHHHHHPHPQSQHFQPQPPPPPPLLLHDPHNLHPLSIYDPRAFAGASSYAHPYSSVEQQHHPHHQSGFMVVPKSEPSVVVGGGGGGGMSDFAATIGLNLGGRTYFSAADDHDFVNRLYRRSRGGGETAAVTVNAPRCQAEGCNADLSHGKHYHRRHKVCEFHSKAATVLAAGLTQRFCQQCSRFHPLNEFDNGKRSCRKRLADHNRRRRKSHQPPDKYQSASRSPAPAESGVNLDCFGGGRRQTSLFYSNG